jgi:hypothetical protein
LVVARVVTAVIVVFIGVAAAAVVKYEMQP